MIDRKKAEYILKSKFKIEKFYEEQWKTINYLLNNEKVLLIQKTGYGKSLCYQFPSIIFDGVTIVFSPLKALMRDQIKSATNAGIPVETINSDRNETDNYLAIEKAKNGEIKILYISPERMEDSNWLEIIKEIKISMIVIDEAHCISVWGHDFRPAYRRIIELVKLLPESIPVLALTATATKKVQNDIHTQIGGKSKIIRGDLLRENLVLNVVSVKNEHEKMVFIKQILNRVPGTGIIYTGTTSNAELFSKWFKFNGINSVYYHSKLKSSDKYTIERKLINNTVKCVVATNSLGMGIDKSDIRFIIHTQIPSSPIHYYQEIGRAGRDGKKAWIFLMYNEKDKKLQESFIESSKPSVTKYNKVIKKLKEEPLKLSDLMKSFRIKEVQLKTILSDLIEQKIIRKNSKSYYEYIPNSNVFDEMAIEKLRERKYLELNSMINYALTNKCRMNFLRNYLDDKTTEVCNNCDNDRKIKYAVKINDDENKKIFDFFDLLYPQIKVDTKNDILNNGVAFFKDSKKINYIIKNKEDFPYYMVLNLAKAFKSKFDNEDFDMALYVPNEDEIYIKRFSAKLGKVLNIPVKYYLKLSKYGFECTRSYEFVGKKILIIDAVYKKNTINLIANLLKRLGAKKVIPLTIAIGEDETFE
ncbi:hypothetical protein OSSY52_21170 [Tepiditoga spiralis]|uniref:ATP-dependent DNA helicase RecQ n=1 Tax=Tepiditoga spiralis TaxID=2108365 RepID=A0A7G1G942_9BACT|nr:RecQ family ATP-dependent DNA helicase [Tepiditoga spiralis]BBE31976.1 hypothetical protein OSSY52_21170 [Tepiditoga spiralis]